MVMKFMQSLVYVLAAAPLVPGLSVAPTLSREASHLSAMGETELLIDPRSSLPEALELVGRVGQSLAHRHLIQEDSVQRTPHGSRPDPDGTIYLSRRVYWILEVSYFVLSSVLIALSAYVYRRAKVWPEVDPEREYKDFTKFSSGPFDCLQDSNTCLWSFVCPCIRWADNMSMLGIMSFWLALTLMAGSWLLNAISGGLFWWLISALVWMVFRQRFREKFDMEGRNECSTYMGDCVLYLFCMPCAIAQEARHLETACKADHEAVKEQRPQVAELVQA